MHIPINKFCLVKPISFFGKLFNILIPCGNLNYFILLYLTDRILHAFHYKYDKSFCRTTIQVILHANNSSRTNQYMQKKAIFYFHFDIFIFENKVTGEKIQLDGQFSLCPAAVECPE
jgi:hypothetical protein